MESQIGKYVRKLSVVPDRFPAHLVESEIEDRLVLNCGRQVNAGRFGPAPANARVCKQCA